MERIMVKISAEGEFVSLRTYSRKYGRSGQFFLWRKDLDELGTKGRILSADGSSYARLYLHKSPEGEEILKVELTWLHSSGNELTGRLERLSLVYRDFLCCVEESTLSGGKACRRLSLKECHRPAIEFDSRRNLKKVARRKGMRRKLGKFLDSHFQWPDAVRIQIVDDSCVPYSFFFREERINGNGICGGIILHGQEDLKKACYGIHT
ncbi:MAG: hypothetical protein HFH85_19320 [Lachnospiraceae bacterium]|jgi:hypothetical protein|nr:hypothetical protein [Lachnospiraceae bacterium]